MDGYKVDKEPFYSSPDGCILAFRGLSTDRNNHPIVVIRHDLASASYQSQLSDGIDEVFNIGLEQARMDGQSGLNILEIQVDLRKTTEKYAIFHVMDTDNVCEMEEQKEGQRGYQELIEYLKKSTLKLAEVARKPLETQRKKHIYEIEEEAFYENPTGTVRLYKGLSSPIIAKRHEFSIIRNEFNLHRELAKAINAGLAQARVQHPHICRIIAMHLETSKAPKRYYLDHVLEALEKDVWREIIERQAQNRRFSEWELWEFLMQVGSALAYAHEKVRYT